MGDAYRYLFAGTKKIDLAAVDPDSDAAKVNKTAAKKARANESPRSSQNARRAAAAQKRAASSTKKIAPPSTAPSQGR